MQLSRQRKRSDVSRSAVFDGSCSAHSRNAAARLALKVSSVESRSTAWPPPTVVRTLREDGRGHRQYLGVEINRLAVLALPVRGVASLLAGRCALLQLLR
jgi:hypothetical protein